ncbi:hypothetical protein AAMO2058_000402000 [Amorphochlora amoebiformis]
MSCVLSLNTKCMPHDHPKTQAQAQVKQNRTKSNFKAKSTRYSRCGQRMIQANQRVTHAVDNKEPIIMPSVKRVALVTMSNAARCNRHVSYQVGLK